GGAPNSTDEITAGGAHHNGDNALEKNKDTPLGQGCFNSSVGNLATTASGPVNLGSAITDTATLSGGTSPTGTLTYKLYSASNCPGLLLPTTKPVTGNGAYTSASYTPLAPGLYYWVVSYGGDTQNAGLSGGCSDSGEQSLVNALVPTITTTANPHSNFRGQTA